jgi:hypothetical protein
MSPEYSLSFVVPSDKSIKIHLAEIGFEGVDWVYLLWMEFKGGIL